MRIGSKKPKEGMIENTSVGSRIFDIFTSAFLALVVFCSIIPMWHVLMSSLSDGKSLFAHEGLVLLPVGGFNLGGFEMIFRDSSIVRSYFVTIFYVVATSVLGLILNVIGGYVLSQPSKLKPVLTLFLIIPMMFGGGLIPTYMVIRQLGMVGTPWAVIIPGCTNAMFVIMMMNAFLQVPQSTVESARIDGAGHLSVMFRVMLPQARGLALVTVINTALMAWNAWFEASVYVPTNKEWWPLQLWIRELTSRNQDFLNYANPDYNRYLVQFAVIVAASLPVIILFPFFQKKLEENMVMGAVKG